MPLRGVSIISVIAAPEPDLQYSERPHSHRPDSHKLGLLNDISKLHRHDYVGRAGVVLH
jgi:hypothetical protein